MRRIAISQRVIDATRGARRDALEQDYALFYNCFDIALIPIPNILDDVGAYLDSLDIEGIILSGGNDVNPALYGGEPQHGSTYADERDRTERAVLEYAIAKRLPVLCECRGLQFMNVYFGGKLRDVRDHVGTHDAAVEGVRLAVNSYHNQGFLERDLASGLQAFAVAADGVIEGACHPEHRIAGIMWHPERDQPDGRITEFNKRLIEDFLNLRGYWK